MRRILFIFGLVCVLATPARLHAWGYDAHKFIVDRAISLLPDAVRPLFEANRTIVVEHSIDPDLWRDSFASIEDPNHYLDFDWEGYGPYPFAGLPTKSRRGDQEVR